MPPQGGGSLGLHRKAEPRGKPHPAQDAQRVLGKACVRIADRAQHAVLQIVQPAERVAQPAVGVPRHRADREIPPGKVGHHVGDKPHAVRVSPIGVAAVHTERGNLKRAVVGQQRQRAVFQPGFEHPSVREHRLHLLRRSRRAQIPVVRLGAAQAVAHAAADRPRLISRVLQPRDGARGMGGQVDHLSSSF